MSTRTFLTSAGFAMVSIVVGLAFFIADFFAGTRDHGDVVAIALICSIAGLVAMVVALVRAGSDGFL